MAGKFGNTGFDELRRGEFGGVGGALPQPFRLGDAERVIGFNVDSRDAGEPLREFPDPGQFAGRIVESGNQRAAQHDFRARAAQKLQVGQDEPVVPPGEAEVFRFIHRLDIEEKKIGHRQNPFEFLPRGEAAALKRGVDSLLFRGVQQGESELGPHHRLAAGERHAAAGVLVENAVLPDFGHDLLDREGTPAEFQRFRRTLFDTLAASDTRRAVELMTPLRRKRMAPRRADLCAAAAPGTSGGGEQQLRFRPPRLRIVAPDATQRTPLEEYRRPDPRAVVDGKFLDIEDNRFGVHMNFYPRWLQSRRRGLSCRSLRICISVTP